MTFDPPQNDDASARRREPLFTAPPILARLGFALIVAYIALRLLPPGLRPAVERYFELTPAAFLAGVGGPAATFAPLVGHMFQHADLIHLGSNSVWLLAFGAPVARRLEAGGVAGPALRLGGRGEAPEPWRHEPEAAPRRAWAGVAFALLFFTSGVFGALVHVAFHPSEAIPLVGASGGVSGLLGALVRFAFRRPPVFSRGPQPLAPLGDPVVLMWSTAIVALNVGVGVFGLGLGGADISVAWLAHLGGYFFGLAAFPAFDAMTRA
ncbi:MAG: rhomboid family intramembrane serine protease [Parvularculaceae bacterium]